MPNPKTLTLHPTPVAWSPIPIVYPPPRPIPPPQRHSTNIIFSANCSKKCRSDHSSFHVGICRSGFGDTAVGSFCPIAPGQSDHPVAVLRMDLPAGEYLTMVALCYCAGILFIITRWSTTPSVHALLACLLLASPRSFWLDSLLTHRRFCSLASFFCCFQKTTAYPHHHSTTEGVQNYHVRPWRQPSSSPVRTSTRCVESRLFWALDALPFMTKAVAKI